MKIRKPALALALFIVGVTLIGLHPAYATNHSGTCTGTFAAADNPHVLTGYCTIPAGQTLTIASGVTVSSPSGYGFLVDGTFNSNGATFTNAYVEYRAGSGGTIQNSTLQDATVYVHGLSTVTPLISNNTVTTSGTSQTAIKVYDAARPVISGNTITTNNFGIAYYDTAGGSVTGNTVRFLAEGANNRDGIRVEGSASPTVSGNTLQDDATRTDYAVVLLMGVGSTATITNNSICATGSDRPLYLGTGAFSAGVTISGNTYPCGQGAGAELPGQTIAAATQLRPLDGITTYKLIGYWTVGAGKTVTIEPGVVVNSPSGYSFLVDGIFNMNGATLNNADVEYRAGSGGTIQTSTIVDATIAINSTVNIGASMLSNTFVSFAAGSGGSIANSTMSGPSFNTAIAVTSASPSFTGNTLTGMNVALGLSGTTNVIIDGNTFDSIATVVSLPSVTSRARVSNNTFAQNTVAVSFGTADTLFSAFPTQFTTNSFIGAPDKNTLRLPSALNVSGTLLAAPVSYSSVGTTVSGGVSITLQPGTVVQNSSQTLFTVDGELLASGTTQAPIVFTSATPKSGTRWRGLRINNKSTASPTVLDSTVVEFAGSSSEGGIRLSNADIQIKNSLIADNAGPGIELLSGSDATISNTSVVQNAGNGITMTSSAPTINLNSIFNNGGNGVNNATCATAHDLKNVRNNYWGDDSGPRDTSDDRAGGGLFNSAGLGDEVSNCVGYDPWIRIGPSQAGTLTIISGGNQVGTVGTTLPQPLVVELKSTLGSLLPNIDVIFSVIEGDATIVQSQPIKTGTNGRASAQLRLGLTPGPVTIAVTARDVNSPLATFTGTGTPGGGMLGFGLQALPGEVTVQPGKKGGVGDINHDGRVNNTDAALLLAVLDGKIAPDTAPAVNFSWSGDVNHDGQIDEADAFILQGYTVGMVTRTRR